MQDPKPEEFKAVQNETYEVFKNLNPVLSIMESKGSSFDLI